MKTLIIGGGKGCRSILELTRSGFLKELQLDIIAVADINPNAPGIKYANDIGLKTFNNMSEALNKLELEVVIELTGKDDILMILKPLLNPNIKLIDHTLARIFWDLFNIQKEQKKQLLSMQKLENRLERERLFLQSIFDNLSDLAVVLDLNFRILRVNQKFADFAVLMPSDALNKKIYDIINPNDMLCSRTQLEEALGRIIESGQSDSVIHITPHPNENHWEISRAPIFDENGKVEALLCTWRRISERVRLYRERESAEQKFKSFINSAQDWISMKDLEGRYIIVNPVIANSFHMPADYFIGKKPEEVFPDKLANNINQHDKLVINTKQYHYFDEIINIDGLDHHFKTVRFPLTDYKGEMIGVCTIARDTTKEERLQEQLIQSEKLAAIGKLAAGVAHEINNPLTGILAYAEDLLEEFAATTNQSEDLKVIIRETLRCRDIVRNLLDFGKQDKPKLETIHFNTIIDNTLVLVQRLPQFKDIQIVRLSAEKLPTIQADPMQLQQVLLNFMLNAAEAMKFKGRITVSCDYDRRSNNCWLTVEDTGPGIPENLADKIFEPFFSTKGTNGLGLAVSWGIIERHRGSIEIDTPPDGGALFKIIIPAYFGN